MPRLTGVAARGKQELQSSKGAQGLSLLPESTYLSIIPPLGSAICLTAVPTRARLLGRKKDGTAAVRKSVKPGRDKEKESVDGWLPVYP